MLKYPFFCCNIKKTCIAVGHVSEMRHSSFSIIGNCQSTTFTTVAGFCGECAELFCLVIRSIFVCLIFLKKELVSDKSSFFEYVYVFRSDEMRPLSRKHVCHDGCLKVYPVT